MELPRYTAVIKRKTAKGYEDIFSTSSNRLEAVERDSRKEIVSHIFYEIEQMDLIGAKLIIMDNSTRTILTEKEWE